ncbi:MAG TPA: hypothetical protein DF712_12730 [Balneola sp.]|nr:hypothetical protein [Bacteroidota bacterium]MAB66524.1 hypothetical protein [Bacteroidota bacterium]HCI72394.1 hypothetical protein [Balneola sp.]HCT53310.1 hypothetical protein [Balneola sp.]|tara:strand:- start:7 stop:390 length:384 start_codon:yes stop_codon:yes gene_type:complete
MGILRLDKFIKFGWITAAITGAGATILAIFSMFSETLIDPFGIVTPWSMIDGLIYFSLAYGIYKKSRISAFLAFSINCYVHFFSQIGFIQNINFIAVFVAFIYLQAFIETVLYHYKRKKTIPSDSAT